jgi:DNA-binding CsgD family transcriptional regulator
LVSVAKDGGGGHRPFGVFFGGYRCSKVAGQLMNNARLRRVLLSAYDAAIDAREWTKCLRELTDTLRSTMSGLHYFDRNHANGGITQFVGADPQWLHDYDVYYASRNAFLIRSGHKFQSGTTLPSEALCPDEELRRTEWYNDYLKPHRIDRNIGVCLFHEAGVMTNLTIMRPTRSFTERELQFVRAVVPHVQQAVRLHRRLEGVSLQEPWSAELLDRVPAGLVLINAKGSIVHMNETARAMIATDDGLSVTRSELRGATTTDTNQLRAAIRFALDDATLQDADVSSQAMPVRLKRPSMRQPLSAIVVPLTRQPSDVQAPIRAVAVISDPERRPRLDSAVLSNLFGLTKTEVRVLATLLGGDSVANVADRLRISTQTARTHVKRILRKTGTHRQSELVTRMSTATEAIFSDTINS